MYKKHYSNDTKIHTFEFDPECYFWEYTIGENQKLEFLHELAGDSDYSINWNVFDVYDGKNGYGKIQNGDKLIQGASKNFPTVSMVDGKLKQGDFVSASPGFARWRIIVKNNIPVCEYVVPGNYYLKDARSGIGQKENGNIIFMTVEGDDTQKRGMTCAEFGQFAKEIGCVFACDCDGGGSVSCRIGDGYLYNQGRKIAGAMTLKKKTLVDMCMEYLGFGYVWGSPSPHDKLEILTENKLNFYENMFGKDRYHFNMIIDGQNVPVSALKWLGKKTVDCSGMIVYAANKLGLIKGDYTAKGLYNLCEHIDNPEYGCLCFNEKLTHVGIYIGNGRYLHARGTYWGVVITDKYNFVKFGVLEGEKKMVTEYWKDEAVDFVKYFQKKAGIVMDGKAGNNTVKKLDEIFDNQGSGDAKEIIDAWNNFTSKLK